MFRKRHRLLIRYYSIFEIGNFQFLDGEVPRFPSYDGYILQFICFANFKVVRVCLDVSDFNIGPIFEC